MFKHIRHINHFRHERNTRGHTRNLPHILSFTALHTLQKPDKTDPSLHATSFTFTKILPHLSSFTESVSTPVLSWLTDLLYSVTSASKQPVPAGLSVLRNFPDDLKRKLLCCVRSFLTKNVTLDNISLPPLTSVVTEISVLFRPPPCCLTFPCSNMLFWSCTLPRSPYSCFFVKICSPIHFVKHHCFVDPIVYAAILIPHLLDTMQGDTLGRKSTLIIKFRTSSQTSFVWLAPSAKSRKALGKLCLV